MVSPHVTACSRANKSTVAQGVYVQVLGDAVESEALAT